MYKVSNSKLLYIVLFFSASIAVKAQNNHFIDHIQLVNIGGEYNSKENVLNFNGENVFYFEFTNITEEFVIKIFPSQKYSSNEFSLNSTADYEVIDSLFYIDNKYYQTTIKFKKIIDNPQLSLKLSIKVTNEKIVTTEVKLFPIAVMDCGFVKIPEDMFIGEENFLEIYSNLPENFVFTNSWNEDYSMHSRLITYKGKPALNIVATQIGVLQMPVFLKLKRPMLDSLGNLKYLYGPFDFNINVKNSRLAYLNSDIKDVFVDEKNRSEGVEIQIDRKSVV